MFPASNKKEEPPVKPQSFNDSLNYWVTVYGFSNDDRALILSFFNSTIGTVKMHYFPLLGNWIHLRFSSVLHAKQALNQNNAIINGRIMVGVVKCTETVSFFSLLSLNLSF